MIDAGICDGDLVVIEKTPEAAAGNIVVALDEYGQNTLKKYAGFDQASREFILQYMNE